MYQIKVLYAMITVQIMNNLHTDTRAKTIIRTSILTRNKTNNIVQKHKIYGTSIHIFKEIKT